MAPKRITKVNKRLMAARTAMGMSQQAFAEKYFDTILRTYQRWEATPDDAKLPGPVRMILAAIENGGRLPK